MRNSDQEHEPEKVQTELDDDGRPKRTGTMWTASAHIITTIIGSGVLSLGWGIAQMGWIAGVSTLVIFSGISLYTSNLLADCYRGPDTGNRNRTYMDTVKAYLGGSKYKLCGLVQYTLLSGGAIGYTITAAISMVAIKKSNCFHKQGHDAPCKSPTNPYIIAFGIAQILLSQIPNISKLSWLSTIATLMSFGYAGIGMGLSFVKVISGQGGKTSLTGVQIGVDLTLEEKIWRMLTAIGNMAFACLFIVIMIEVQDTLRSSPPENKVMKKANVISTCLATALYLLCGVFGYAALGNSSPGNILTGFGFYEPFWLINLANVFIVVHLLGAYQVVAQPVFNSVETWAGKKWPKSKFVHEEYTLRIGPIRFEMKVKFLRLVWRIVFVVMTTVVSMTFPFFNEVLGLLGAIAYWPLTVYFPVTMHISKEKISKRRLKWYGLQVLNLVCFVAALGAGCSSIQGIVKALRK